MNKNERLEDILNNALPAGRATPPPFLLTRIEAKLKDVPAETGSFARTVRPARAVVLLGILSLLAFANFEILSSQAKSERHAPSRSAVSDYNLTGNLDLY